MPNITGRSYLPKSTTPRTGKWTLRLDPSSVSGVPGMGTTGTSDVVSGTVTARDGGTGATITGLVTGWYFARFEPDTSDEQAPDDGPTDWLRFNLTANTTWKAIVDSQPVGPPPTPTLAQQAAASRAGAEAAKALAEAAAVRAEDAAVEAEAVGASNDTIIAGRINESSSATRGALDDVTSRTIGAQAAAKWEPTVPNIGIRSDAFFLRGSADGNVESQVSAFLADANLKGKRRLVGYAKAGSPIAVPANTWLDASEAVLEQTTTAQSASLNVTGDNVRINGLRVIGPNGTATYRASENAIRAVGASASSPIRGLRLEDVSINGFGFYGIFAQHVYDLEILGCDITNIGYAGVMMLSVFGGRVEGGTIDGAVGNGINNSYGIAASRAEGASLVTNPRSANIAIHNVVVRNIPWEGIDTHGGIGMTVSGCRVTGCQVGIAMVGSDGDTQNPLYAPRDFVIDGNTVDSLRTDGGAGIGILVAGASGALSSDPAVQYATGTVTGNVVTNHGTESNSNNGAIHARNTRGLAIVGNRIQEPSPHGISLWYDNRGASVVGNTVTDAWSNGSLIPSAIALRSSNNTGRAYGNTLTVAGKAATYKNVNGIRSDGTGTDFGTNANLAALNLFSAATTPVQGIS